MSIFYLNGSNDLATVPISAIYIRLLVKQLFSLGKGLGSKFLIRNYLFRKCQKKLHHVFSLVVFLVYETLSLPLYTK